MTMESELLARCHGFDVLAEDGVLGYVETPLFPPDARHPDFLVVRVPAIDHNRFPVLHVSLVRGIDQNARQVHVRMRRSEAALLPEHLPLDRWS